MSGSGGAGGREIRGKEGGVRKAVEVWRSSQRRDMRREGLEAKEGRPPREVIIWVRAVRWRVAVG